VALDFPESPVIGEEWRDRTWDGEKWACCDPAPLTLLPLYYSPTLPAGTTHTYAIGGVTEGDRTIIVGHVAIAYTTSVSVNGIAADLLYRAQSAAGGQFTVSMWRAYVPAGKTLTITDVLPIASTSALFVWVLYNADPVPVESSWLTSSTAPQFTDPIPDVDGAVIAIGASAANPSWTTGVVNEDDAPLPSIDGFTMRAGSASPVVGTTVITITGTGRTHFVWGWWRRRPSALPPAPNPGELYLWWTWDGEKWLCAPPPKPARPPKP
jgi:hypothetical protein